MMKLYRGRRTANTYIILYILYPPHHRPDLRGRCSRFAQFASLCECAVVTAMT